MSKIDDNQDHESEEPEPAGPSRVVVPFAKNGKFPSNAISNAKYNPITFLPIILYEQFKFFINLYFLIVALSQIVPSLRIGYLSSYVLPLVFVLFVTMSKEALDDIARRRRDAEANKEGYEVVGKVDFVRARDLKVGDLVFIKKDQRVPADMILLKSSEANGETFIRTDQLDGETDWKLRIACPLTQSLLDETMSSIQIMATAPSKSIHSFLGRISLDSANLPLSIDNTLWANTVLASGHAIGCVIYTGSETRQAMNTSKARAKVGLLELEINSLSKILCICVFLLSLLLVGLSGFRGQWYISIFRFLVLFSSIIPVSLRVNLDLGKSIYAYLIEHDKSIPETIVRTSTIPEDLGRIEYLLTDKTGTLTQNDMELKKIHVGTVSYAGEAMDEVAAYVSGSAQHTRSRRDIGVRVRDLVFALAVCHNVTPVYEDGESSYQAASPDEIAIVKWTESVGLTLARRDRTSIALTYATSKAEQRLEILQIFPFSSETKRMGIVVRDSVKDEIWFFLKGADSIMARIVQKNDWLEEETGNMAREGLRTLVIGRKKLTTEAYNVFLEKYTAASLVMKDRDSEMLRVVSEYLEKDLELLGLTGVEDKLQENVKQSLELLRNAGIKIWMLTGDKVETARCVAVSAKLVPRGQYIHTIAGMTRNEIAFDQLEYLRTKGDCCLLIDGESLSLFLEVYRKEFIEVAVTLPAVIACRCSPTQKAEVAKLIKTWTKKRVCCIGDGGNDVSMIQAADVGVGIVGKEGRQASLAADFSILQFCYLTKLLVWHGRNSYKQSAKLAQFIIHRGLIISVAQAVYSISSSFEPLALYQGLLLVGYATIYTMMPVFSMVLDRDVDEDLAEMYPELYKELTEGRSLSYLTFFIWVLISVYQGAIIQGIAQILVGLDMAVFKMMVSVSFTALFLNELLMVAMEIITWNKIMLATEIVTVGAYIASLPFLGDYYGAYLLSFTKLPLTYVDLHYIITGPFFWKTTVATAAALVPIWLVKVITRRVRPPTYAKVRQR
ncbi:hypothetical protein POJ06DRAFT_197265 [Lipomyces tetrasporus]|uniref:Phospholipid-transporting ATPase n=1 Tax=Lipomyces tetrasporus TaxID=54092 RepID=A0AAD7QSS6_9ASCO|nr:uncharacterized protein POJ06DRAFT_197265 [Lipomyces tetrasporus]KAJ8100790.1 hypothetical protein POJ06DRAFT_197265 [Lipomyces tetrasporus]